jgi:branched-chain amino acid transport system substrate-binding protein
LRRKRILAFVPVLSLLSIVGCTAQGTSTDKSDIVIAASLELTGSHADVGKAYENALRLKVEQVNASGAARSHKVILRILDNRGEVGLATTQVGEFVGDPTVSAIITGSSSESLLAVAKTVNDKGVPTIALAPSSQVSTPVTDRRFVFKLAPNANHDAAALVSDLTQSGIHSLGLLSSTDAYGHDAKDVLTREVAKANIPLTAVGQLNAGDDTFSQPAHTISQAKPDAVVVQAFPAQASTAVNALHTAGYRGRVYLDAIAAGPLFLTGTSAAEEGSTLVFTETLAIDDVIATTPAKAARKQWFQDYTARYGSYQASASFAADAVQLIVDSVNLAGSATDHNGIRAALETVRFDGLSGPIRITPNDHSGLMPQSLTILVARSGRWRLS